MRAATHEIGDHAADRSIGEDAAASVSAVLKALADPLRLRMLSAIASDPRGESCVDDLAELAEVSQPTISHHLKVLKGVGLLASERRGTWVWYRIDRRRRTAVTTLLDAFAPEAALPAAAEPTSRPFADRDADITALSGRLADEHPQADAGAVLNLVRESYTALIRTASDSAAVLRTTERFARQRLADLTRDRNGAPQVLFVCVANAGRSQLAAALVNLLSDGAITARSAGSAPAASVHPHVRSMLEGIEGSAAADRFPKPLTDDAVRAADVVITMGCGDVCPILPGVRYDDWPVGDPALASLEGTAAITADITARVRVLIAELLNPATEESP
ncbi:metalloregulator ArsR/SmtB family transcription factor [Microbacterium sp. NPDC055903]